MEQILFIMLPLEQLQTELNSLSTYDNLILTFSLLALLLYPLSHCSKIALPKNEQRTYVGRERRSDEVLMMVSSLIFILTAYFSLILLIYANWWAAVGLSTLVHVLMIFLWKEFQIKEIKNG